MEIKKEIKKTNKHKKILATVVSNKRYFEGTIVVVVNRQVLHEKYGKVISYKKRFTVEYSNTKENLEIGQKVYITSCAPMSKTKTHRILEVLEDKC
jgi:small subunit ribosomal protein S17